MIDFGKKLKNARLGMSLSLQEVSERSKIRIHILEATSISSDINKIATFYFIYLYTKIFMKYCRIITTKNLCEIGMFIYGLNCTKIQKAE